MGAYLNNPEKDSTPEADVAKTEKQGKGGGERVDSLGDKSM
jgi:hypothetical protein